LMHVTTREEREERRARGPDVRARIDVVDVSESLLRREIRGRAHHRARLRLRRAQVSVANACDAEVEDLEVLPDREEEILRFQIAMHDARRMRALEHVEERDAV